MVILYNDLILFGGINDNNQKFNELYNFDFKVKKWTILFPSGEYPPPRTYHNMIYYNKKIFVFGGYSTTILNDCYSINLSEKYLDLEENNIKETENIFIETNEMNMYKSKRTIFLDSNKYDDDHEFIENNVDKALGNANNENSKLKENLLIFEYREENKLLKNQVNELKKKIENEVNKNLCKVIFKFY